MLGLRIGAPLTAQIASLKEHRGANARSIVEAEFLDVENMAFHLLPPPLFLHFIVGFREKEVNKPQKKNPGDPGFFFCGLLTSFGANHTIKLRKAGGGAVERYDL
jgi:hypothetical protein